MSGPYTIDYRDQAGLIRGIAVLIGTRDYLTGFHKRKVAKKEAKTARAKERQKVELLEARREVSKALVIVSRMDLNTDLTTETQRTRKTGSR